MSNHLTMLENAYAKQEQEKQQQQQQQQPPLASLNQAPVQQAPTQPARPARKMTFTPHNEPAKKAAAKKAAEQSQQEAPAPVQQAQPAPAQQAAPAPVQQAPAPVQQAQPAPAPKPFDILGFNPDLFTIKQLRKLRQDFEDQDMMQQAECLRMVIKNKVQAEKSSWTAADDGQLIEYTDKYGKQWSVIASLLKKTETEVSHRWDILKNKFEKIQKMKDNQ